MTTTSTNGRGRIAMTLTLETWPLNSPFQITGYTWSELENIVVSLRKDNCCGRGEAAGVYYRNDRPQSMLRQLEALRGQIETGITRESAQALLPPGGARNALDCALWDLEAKLTGQPAWRSAGLDLAPRPLVTTFTCGADDPEKMAAEAMKWRQAKAIKLKLTGERLDTERVRAVRAARPDVKLGIDANQGFTLPFLEWLLPVLVDSGVELIEQPLPIGQEKLLLQLRSPIPLAADESAQSLKDLPGLVSLFQVVNIKLDKCGGLTEGLAMAKAAKELGLQVMVGNMMGTALAMAPGFILGQHCAHVDLDGALSLRQDRHPPVDYSGGLISCPPQVWGNQC